MQHVQTSFADTALVPESKILRTPSLAEFQQKAGDSYDAAFLSRDLSKLQETRLAFIKLMEGKNKLRIQAYAFGGTPNYQGSFGTLIDAELHAMLQTYYEIHNTTAMRILIISELNKPLHSDPDDILNCNWGSLGSGIETKNGFEYPQEGHWNFIKSGTQHISHPDIKTEKVTTAVFDNENNLDLF